jgi:hypothetical protein
LEPTDILAKVDQLARPHAADTADAEEVVAIDAISA